MSSHLAPRAALSVVVGALTALGILIAPASALACSVAPDYFVVVEPDQVLLRTGAVQCTPDRVMLRQDLDTGDVVRLAPTCDGDAWVDRCVPAGRHRYGLEVPMPVQDVDCVCGPYTYYVDVVVDPPADGCTSAALPVNDVPWKGERLICSPPPATCGSSSGGSDPTACPAATPVGNGCSTTGGDVGGTWVVVLLLAAMLRRRAV